MFNSVLASILESFGISAFAKDKDGKSVITKEQEKELKDKWGDKFVAHFKKELAAYEVDGKKADGEIVQEEKIILSQDGAKLAEELKQAQALAKKLKEEKNALAQQVAKLEKEEIDDNGVAVTGEAEDMKKAFKPDMAFAHNQYLEFAFSGKPGAAYTGDSTIDTSELKKEFGKYVSNERIEIIKGLTGKTESTQYMSTIMTDKVEVRAQQAAIDSVLQQFTPYWTPKGKSKFTPLTIRNFKCKINVPIIPSNVMEAIIGYLYDEDLEPKDMPVVKYILYQLVFPKLDEEREMALAIGEFKETDASKDGDDATDANEVMDGYLTQLRRHKSEGKLPITWLLDGEELNDAVLVEQIEKAVDQVKPLYKKKTMYIHADPELITRYGKAYRKQYPWLKNEDGEKIKVDFSKFTFAPLEGMRGTGAFFITPKENFKHLRSKDPQSTKVWMQGENYTVKIFGEWWEATGFWIAEAIFAYLPPEGGESGSAASQSIESSGSDQGGI